MHGSFGTALTHYVNEDQTDFVNARHSVNVLDHAQEIARRAQAWLADLEAGVI